MPNLLETYYLNVKDWLNQTLWMFNNSRITPLNLLQFAFLICLVIWLSRFVLRTMNGMAEKRSFPQRFMLYRLARLVYYIILVLGLLTAISTIGVDFTQLVLLAGALGVGVGLGLQTIFNNFFSGIILLFEDQLKLGDWIELEGGVKGEIREINFRTITLRTQDGMSIFVPNSSLINSRVTLHWTPLTPYRCLRIPFAVKPNSDKEVIFEILPQEIKKIPLTKSNLEPSVYLTQLGENKLNFELWVWVDEKERLQIQQEVVSIYLNAIETQLKQAGIDLA